jgi:hypothetical protein
MEDWNESFLAVEVERELEKHKAEREKWNLEPGTSATATGTNSGCGKLVLWLCIGLLFLRFVAELFS